MKPATRIAANDSALAHALTNRAITDGGERSIARLDAVLRRGGLSVAKLSRAIPAAFGAMAVSENITRLHGTRARGEWIVLLDNLRGDLTPWHVCMSRQGPETHPLKIRFAGHAVARLAQRTVGAADMRVIGPILARHLMTVIHLLDKAKTAAEFRTASAEGAFLWGREDDRLVAATWLDARSAADPSVRADCTESNDEQTVMRLTKGRT